MAKRFAYTVACAEERAPESNIKINSSDMVFTTFSILLGYVCKKKNSNNKYILLYGDDIVPGRTGNGGKNPWTSVAVEARKSRSIILVPVCYGNCFILN